MTPGERRFPKTINGSRKKRIARGAGQQIQDVNRLLKQHMQMERMMKKVSKGGMKKFMRGMPGGGLPPGFALIFRPHLRREIPDSAPKIRQHVRLRHGNT